MQRSAAFKDALNFLMDIKEISHLIINYPFFYLMIFERKEFFKQENKIKDLLEKKVNDAMLDKS